MSASDDIYEAISASNAQLLRDLDRAQEADEYLVRMGLTQREIKRRIARDAIGWHEDGAA